MQAETNFEMAPHCLAESLRVSRAHSIVALNAQLRALRDETARTKALIGALRVPASHSAASADPRSLRGFGG